MNDINFLGVMYYELIDDAGALLVEDLHVDRVCTASYDDDWEFVLDELKTLIEAHHIEVEGMAHEGFYQIAFNVRCEYFQTNNWEFTEWDARYLVEWHKIRELTGDEQDWLSNEYPQYNLPLSKPKLSELELFLPMCTI